MNSLFAHAAKAQKNINKPVSLDVEASFINWADAIAKGQAEFGNEFFLGWNTEVIEGEDIRLTVRNYKAFKTARNIEFGWMKVLPCHNQNHYEIINIHAESDEWEESNELPTFYKTQY